MTTVGSRHLTKAQNFLLAAYVEEHYIASGLNDAKFAARAASELKDMPPLSDRHIAEARAIFAIPNNRVVQAEQRQAERAARDAERRAAAAATAIANPPIGALSRDFRISALEAALSSAMARISALESRQACQATLDV